jgi:hypothetical protein
MNGVSRGKSGWYLSCLLAMSVWGTYSDHTISTISLLQVYEEPAPPRTTSYHIHVCLYWIIWLTVLLDKQTTFCAVLSVGCCSMTLDLEFGGSCFVHFIFSLFSLRTGSMSLYLTSAIQNKTALGNCIALLGFLYMGLPPPLQLEEAASTLAVCL